MINLDSLKLQFSPNLALVDLTKYDRTTTEKDNLELTSYKLKRQFLRTGIKEIYINDTKCSIDFSSKFVPGLYQDMININTIERYLTDISNSGLIKLNVPEVINNSLVRTCDTTNNMKVENVATYINAMTVYKLNDKYNFKTWINESIEFERKAKTNVYKEHLMIYNKLPELMTARNKDFRTGIDINYFKNVLRFESRFTTFALMRKLFEVPDNNLITILNSDAKVNYKILSRITDIKNIDTEIFNNINSIIGMKEKHKHSKIRNTLGSLSILHSCNYDIDLVKLYFKTNSTANNSKYIREMKQLLKTHNEVESKTGIDEKVHEMKEFLKVA
jgi:hypothetical protein